TDADNTTAAAMLENSTDRRLPLTKMAEATVTRYTADAPASKAKRRVYAISKLLKKMKLDRTARTGVWEQLWGQMNVPAY
ncbi:hypothetical protein, partial [Klebsiella pneumoniae]|uniref:hypothetical protein n=1 Tax=Klebsiella pneumoniae TaxID=573 RepID=UPI003A808B80